MLITNKKILLTLVLLIVFMTVGLPLAQILRYENVIKNGTSYKVKCRAYDPYDPFMGRYVRLNLSETVPTENLEFAKDIADKENEYFYHDGFVEISADENGFVKYEKLIENKDKLLPDKNYLKCRIHGNYRSEEDISNRVQRKITITVENIDRYYMSDKLAKPAEDAIRDIFRARGDRDADSNLDKAVYIELKVLNTSAVPMQLYIDDTRIEDYISK